MSTESTERVRYWKSGDSVGIETTTTWNDSDGGRTVGVVGAAPDDARIIDQGEYDRIVNEQNMDRAIFESDVRAKILKRVADKQSAIAKLTELGLTEDQAKALTS
jgi:predicted DNA binding protein